MITSAYSKNSNSSGFNPILQNFTRWFVRQFSPKQCAEFSWLFVDRVLLIILLRRTIFETLKSPKLKYLETYSFQKNSAHRFEDHICTNNLERIFFEKAFQGLRAFFALQNFWFWSQFFPQKISFIVFFKCDYLSSI